MATTTSAERPAATRPAGGPSPDSLAWLRASGEPARREFRAAGLFNVLTTATGVAQWGALAWLLSSAFNAHGVRTGSAVGPLCLLAASVVVRSGGAYLARARAQAGALLVADRIRKGLVASVFANTTEAEPVSGPAAAHSAVELTADVAAYHEITAPSRLSAPISTLLVLGTVAVVHWPAAVLLAVATPVLPVNMRVVGMATEEASRKQLAAMRSLSEQLLDRFTGMHVLSTLGAVERERDTVEEATEHLNRTTMGVLRRAFVSSAVMDAVVTFAIAITATYVGLSALGYLQLPGLPHLTLFTGVFTLFLAPLYFVPLREFAAGFHERDKALAAVPLLRSHLPLASFTQPSGAQPLDAQPLGARPLDAPAWLPALRGAPELSLDHVTVRHPSAAQPVLDDLLMTAPAGLVTVITAPSGAGKSTLLGLLGGLRRPTAGTVRWIGPDGDRHDPELGRATWLGQQTVVLNATLDANIRLGDPAATPAEVRCAAIGAGLGPLLAALPGDLDTVVGDRGLGLSAGEARRVALARALLRDSALWLLDEPTAHLDAGTELEVLDAIFHNAHGRTVVIATHSPEVLARADVIWRLTDGRLSDATQEFRS